MGKLKKIGIGFGIVIVAFFMLSIIAYLASDQSATSFETNYEMGDIVKLKNIDIEVLRTSTSGANFWNSPDGTFFHVYMNIENMDKSTQTFSPIQFVLVDGKGREFNPVLYFTLGENSFDQTVEIQPNLPIEKFVTFDIPYDPELRYDLQIINAGKVCLQNC